MGQARDFADKLRNGNLSRHQAIRAYKSVFLPMISYHLGASTLTLTQLARIHSVVEQAYLAKGGLNRKFPKAVIRGPRLYGGQGDPGLCTRKGYQQLQLFLGRIRNADTQGDIIRQEIEFLQLTAGIRDPIFFRERIKPQMVRMGRGNLGHRCQTVSLEYRRGNYTQITVASADTT